MYSQIDRAVTEKLENIAGRENVIADPDRMFDYGHDEFSLRDISRVPDLVVKPKTAEEVAAILRLANEYKIPVTPRGGATGLCGGCVPSSGGIVLSLEKMNRVLEIDPDNQMAVAEAGVTLRDFEQSIEDAGFYFPPHPGEESAMIGGMIATNAGGSRAVKYGVIRNYVRGLEVVVPTGEIIHLGGKLIKSSTGYNLLHLFIGSEGTLGVITGATIQFLTKPAVTRSLVIPFAGLEKAIETVPLMFKKKIVPLALEFVPLDVIKISEEHLHKKWPCSQGQTHLLVILDAQSEEEMDRLSQAVAEAALENEALDVFIADTAKKQETVLDIRSKIYEAIKSETIEILDISIPRAEIVGHVKKVQEVSRKYDIWLPTFGHAGDGNVHTHIMKARYENGAVIPLPESEWRDKSEKVREELYEDCRARGGVISGEHGIGLIKKKYLAFSLEPRQVELMKGLKKVFDPNNILNPGKIFD
ncbi:MAG: FAD-binding oxidoreductase [Candidatus Aminicenantes bacterium]|nr:FAD-binding oxidoreductase [Candidatus Aminicenantes bacterium]